jgi:hypothetical protein
MSKNHQRTCITCKKPFIAKNLRGVYCSAKCKVSHSRKKKRNVAQNGNVTENVEDARLKEARIEIEKEEQNLVLLQNKVSGIKSRSMARELDKQKTELEEKKLLKQRACFLLLNGKRRSGGEFTQMGFDIPENQTEKLFYVVLGSILDNTLNNRPVCYDYTSEIKSIDTELAKIKKKAFLFFDMEAFKLSHYEKEIEIKIGTIQTLNEHYKKLEQEHSKKAITRDLDQLKDQEGFVSAKDVKNINFADRIILSGDIGLFLGALEKDKCAITLTGKQGSGKTFFSFDLISKFIERHFSVAYFSCEEGITQLTREKLIHYQLDNAESLKIKEQANLLDIHRAASSFDVIVIDSWGKLNADISEFDKLRLEFPKTIIVAIFQQTSSGQMRGGTMAAYDAGINIETSIEHGKRIAVCKKNRYGKTGLKYLIDAMEIGAS